MITRIRDSRWMKIAVVVMVFEILLPLIVQPEAHAITGGPAQPEFTTFTPIGASDMVNLFTGDFSYNIPLMDVGGYPINLSYSSGIGMEQQASSVGLGWTLNAGGVITRNMRGIPDDFNGDDEIVNTTSLRPDFSVGASLSKEIEILGGEIPATVSNSLFYNSYKGIGRERSIKPSFRAGDKNKTHLTFDLGLSANSQEGIGIRPKVGLSREKNEEEEKDNVITYTSISGGGALSASYNSRVGLRSIGIESNYSKTTKEFKKHGDILESISNSSNSWGVGSSIPIGANTYIPQINQDMQTYSVSANITLGNEFLWIAAGTNVSGYFNIQAIRKPDKSNPSYGFFYSHIGRDEPKAVHDFNREKDGVFTRNTPSLPMSQMTYDIYTVAGQGVSGMYRPHRDFGTVYDPRSVSFSTGGSFGGDMEGGNVFKGGFNVDVNFSHSQTGRWTGNANESRGLLSFRDRNDADDANPITYEPFFMKGAGEFTTIDNDYFTKIQGFNPTRVDIEQPGRTTQNYLRNISNNTVTEVAAPIAGNERVKREIRNQPMSMLTAEHAAEGGVDKEIVSYNINGSPLASGSVEHTTERYGENGRRVHHVSEVTVTQPDGSRYVYGQQTYNYLQREVSFNAEGNAVNIADGLIAYQPNQDNTTGNNRGIDHYFSSTELPPYANAYQLTAVLSSDYIDIEGDGPTLDDFGTYTKFNYTTVHSRVENGVGEGPYRWRNPYYEDSGNFSEGLKSVNRDNKANYLYGEKEIKMIHSIETKNYVAEFTYSDRKDAFEVSGEDGGQGNKTLKKLCKISLYTHCDRKENQDNATPLKEVHFVYDYSLCRGIPSYRESGGDYSCADPIGNLPDFNPTGGGKLTLRQVYFTYENSQKGTLSPYTFHYGDANHNGELEDGNGGVEEDFNPTYCFRGNDRWGCYKPNELPNLNSDAPYVSQETASSTANPFVEHEADIYAGAWCLTTIQLPSGGVIKVDLESDDYAYVQDRRATMMHKVLGFTESPSTTSFSAGDNTLYDGANDNEYLYIAAPEASNLDEFKEKYIGNGKDEIKENLFFKFMMDVRGGNTPPSSYEYVSGYVPIEDIGFNDLNTPNDDSDNIGWIRIKPVSVKDFDFASGDVHPIAKTAIQFTRLHLPEIVAGEDPDLPNTLDQILFTVISRIPDMLNMVAGVNSMLKLRGTGRDVDLERSFVRLQCPTYSKLGGGVRVSQIRINDSWGTMSGSSQDDYDYGQTYDYTMEADDETGTIPDDEVISSGVAVYEPFVGNEENPMREPVAYSEERKLAPDNDFYQEKPYGEMFFPSPSVGYSRVKVQNKKRDGVKRTATGYAIHEFYTAKDFPIKVRDPHLERLPPTKPLTSILGSLLNLNIADYLTTSQSYSIELNDMHGKPKAQYIYAEKNPDNLRPNDPISGVQYYYKQSDMHSLDNEISVINKRGEVETTQAGLDIDMTIDERQSTNRVVSLGVETNVDASAIPIPPAVIPLPSVWLKPGIENVRFRSIANTKVITRYGILEKVTAHDLGSYVETENLAWDRETGEVLLTRTQNDFEDPIYAFTYPAHWGYDGMGQAYKNIGIQVDDISLLTNPNEFFVPGDEVLVGTFPNFSEAWVTAVNNVGVSFQDRDGNPVTVGNDPVRVIRSGRRNQQGMPIGSITTLSDPIQGNQLVFDDILNAGAIEFKDEWTGFCNCDDELASTNPYINGELGSFRPVRSYAFLTDRNQSNESRNTNIRLDGTFEDFQPFWVPNAPEEEWSTNPAQWTFASEVTLVSPYGMELENRDALNRYSAADYRYNHTLPSAVASNSQYKEMGYDNFEDYDCLICPDDHFSFKEAIIEATNSNISNAYSHTGRRSIQVGPSSFVEMEKPIDDSPCN